LSEAETLGHAAGGRSIARFGDGELRLAVGSGCSSQVADKDLAAELVGILTRPSNVLPCIPNFQKTPNRKTWDRYAAGNFARLYALKIYGSSFITRPDNAPWIDNDEYWRSVERLWEGKDVVLVSGDSKSLRAEQIAETARSVRVVTGPRTNAYAVVDRLEEEIAAPAGVVILCLGAAATVLAARLAHCGVHALDLGHIGMFMRHAGAFRFSRDDLASELFRRSALPWRKFSTPIGADETANTIASFAVYQLGATSILDYGAGSGWLAHNFGVKFPSAGPRVINFDLLDELMPKPADVVVGVDLLNYCEPDKRAAVFQHMCLLAKRGVYLEHYDQFGRIAEIVMHYVRGQSEKWEARISTETTNRQRIWLTRRGGTR
jgi:hypothetical protein